MSPKVKEFNLFDSASVFTDDSVMTIAIAEALINAGKDPDEEVAKRLMIHSMKKWGRAIPHAGYGGMFGSWLRSEKVRAIWKFRKWFRYESICCRMAV